jgi:hypothetical protein
VIKQPGWWWAISGLRCLIQANVLPGTAVKFSVGPLCRFPINWRWRKQRATPAPITHQQGGIIQCCFFDTPHTGRTSLLKFLFSTVWLTWNNVYTLLDMGIVGLFFLSSPCRVLPLRCITVVLPQISSGHHAIACDMLIQVDHDRTWRHSAKRSRY